MTMLRASPYIACRDVDASIDFFRRTLGFEPRLRMGEPANFAIIFKDDVSLTLTLDRQGEIAGRSSTYITVRGVDALYERCKAAGATMDQELGSRDYGMKDFTIHDLDENHIMVGEPLTG